MTHNPNYPKASSRTFEAVSHFSCYGENWGSSISTVRLYLENGEIKAEIDGHTADLEAAVRRVNAADTLTVIEEVLIKA